MIDNLVEHPEYEPCIHSECGYLKFTDLHGLNRESQFLSFGQQRNVGRTLDRITRWPQRFGHPGQLYAENAGIIAMSGWSGRNAFCGCGNLSFRPGQNDGPCQHWRICPYCAHRRRMRMLRQFLPAFHRGRWWFLTISDQSTCFEPPFEESIDLWWEGCRYGLYALLRDHRISGAFVFETLHIDSYWPVPWVLPHDHAVILADEVTSTMLEDLRREIEGYRGEIWNSKKRRWTPPSFPEPLPFKPTTRTYRLPEQHDLCAVLGYLCRPINWAEKYIEQWPLVGHEDRIDFNQNVVEAIDGWEIFLPGILSGSRRQHYFLGQLQHAHGSYVGVVKRERDSTRHDRRVRDLLVECNAERTFGLNLDQLGRPVEIQGGQPGST